MSVDLGLHSNNLNYLKNSSVRMQNIQKLRNIYSSSEKKGKISNSFIERFSTTHTGGFGRSANLNNLNLAINIPT
jgi:hypothetical protein